MSVLCHASYIQYFDIIDLISVKTSLIWHIMCLVGR